MNRLAPIIFVLAGIALLIANAVFVVNEGQQAIITQFGKPVGKRIEDAGLYFKIPVAQKVHLFEKRILKWDGDPNEIPTKDKKYIWIDTTARWRITDPLLFLQRVNNMSRANLTLNDLINGSVRDFVTKNNLIEIIRSSDWDAALMASDESAKNRKFKVLIGRDQFSQLVLNEVSKTTAGFGIELLDVLVKRVNYTTQVRQKVYDRMISERKRIAAEKRSEGEAIKNRILGEMDRELKDIESTSYKTAEEIRGQADGSATKIYGDVYSQDPEFYKFLATIESYKKTLGENSRLIIDAKSPLYQYLANRP